MKKVISSSEMLSIEKIAYVEGFSAENFMLCAGKKIAFEIDRYISEKQLAKKIYFLCGKGNNSGDAYVAAAILLDQSYEIEVLQCVSTEKMSPLCKKHHDNFLTKNGKITYFSTLEDLKCHDHSVVVDALFGTGLIGAPKDPYKTIIEKINQCHCKIISIDLPSGLDGNNGETAGSAIIADLTLTLRLPKLGSFLNNGWNHTGSLKILDFGLPEKFIKATKSYLWMFEKEDLSSYFPKLIPNRHKYQAGYVIGIAGSCGMTGAAHLSTAAALCGGAGIVRLLCPESIKNDLVLLPEILKTSCERSDTNLMIDYLNKASSAFIGPGIGLDENFNLKVLLDEIKIPVVLDADALNRISIEKIPFPKNCIITPHMGEMGRLLGKKIDKVDENLWEECQNFVDHHFVTLILKGGPSYIFHPNKPIVVVPQGTPGMATAGSGDVLTGLTASLLAQGLSTHQAAIASVFIHGYSGQQAAKKKTDYCMVASDIIDSFSETFKLI